MLRPIPSVLLTDTAVFIVPDSMDVWQTAETNEFTVNNVHIQNTNEIRKTKDNTEIILRSILFIDAKLSKPKLDYISLMRQAETIGAALTVIVNNETYTVVCVDALPNVPKGIHHYELGLV